MLKYTDKINIFDCSDGVSPFLLLDDHGSRFELPFLEYITNEAHNWMGCIGVPYATCYWQVGDSMEQNQCFKIALAKAKCELVDKKENSGLVISIEKTDIVGLVGCAWEQSFARVQCNLKAISWHGWGPLNYNLLQHPEINLKKDKVYFKLHSNIDVSDLNVSEGLAGSLTEKIVLF
jgi:hypothetical protein